MQKISELSNSQIVFILILLNIILKIPFLFINVVPSDIHFYYSTGWLLSNDVLPYESFNPTNLSVFEIFLNSRHPNGPFNYLFYYMIIEIFGYSTFSIKLPMLVADILISIYIYKILILFVNKESAFYASLVYSFCIPCFYPGILIGCDELITGAFATAGIYYFLLKRNILSGMLIGIGISYKMYPIFFILPIFIYCYHKRELSQFVLIILTIILTFFIISLPYILLTPSNFLQYTFGQSNRLITISYGYYIQNSWFYRPIFSIDTFLFISLTPHFFFEILLVAGFFYYDFRKAFKLKRYDSMAFFRSICYYVLILPVISLSFNYRYTQWLIPMLVIYFFSKDDSYSISNNHESFHTLQKKKTTELKLLFFMILSINCIILVVNFYQISSGDLRFIPFGIYHFNNYIFSFFIIFILYLLINFYIQKSNKLTFSISLISFLQGASGLMLYYSLQIRYLKNAIEKTFVILSLIFLFLSLFYTSFLLFDKQKKVYNLIKV